ncbi:MAG: methionyl-tRNA formyltransferase [Candidatus Pacebacteria bacterium]|jgi:methionyl-tRNA formyltransferase|nr:methionyl-tRNA formyltransferase [Candidatus Paceibacterota bacterium]|tara:strand:+ start:10869 stop:11744 length:876 start_codon:yes stop_codon:yes gene_type:complete
MIRKNKPKIAFFGTSRSSTVVLEKLKKAGLTPNLVVTSPDKPKGRNLIVTSPPVGIWAEKNIVNFVQPEEFDKSFLDFLREENFDLFVTASYGKILPKEILDIPKYGMLNVHPSLLPKLRGASPIISAILGDEKKTGVTIMLVDEKVDHGSILAQASIELESWSASASWPPKASELEEILFTEGGKLLAEVIPKWIAGKIKPEVQDESQATFTKKIKKEDGLIELDGDPYQNLLKIRAFDEWPGVYFLVNRNGKKIRVKITDAEIEDNKLKIKKVIPEGKKEMDYEDYLRG